MKKGEEVYVQRDKIYGENKYRYQLGRYEKEYSHHILVIFDTKSGESYRESFLKHEVYKKGEVKNESIY